MKLRKLSAAELVFWGSAGIFVYSYLLFPLLTFLKGRLSTTPPPQNYSPGSSELPTVTAVIAAYNEEDVIQSKIDNCLDLDYPADKLNVIVASDGSTDGTNHIVSSVNHDRVHLIALPRQGKNQTVNRAIEQAAGDILLMTDADSFLEQDALFHLVAPFADPAVGGTAGDYRYRSSANGEQGEHVYWRFDRLLKEMQSQSGDVISATGQIYAIRRELFQPLPSGVTDDAYITRNVISQRYRLIFVPQARASGPVADSSGEYRRKVRVTTRGLNTVWQQKQLLNPFAYGAYAWQLWSHKVIRRLMAIPLILIAFGAVLSWPKGRIYQIATIAQILFHSLALIGFALRTHPRGRNKLIHLPFHFDMVYAAALKGAFHFLRQKQVDVWQAERI